MSFINSKKHTFLFINRFQNLNLFKLQKNLYKKKKFCVPILH